MSISHGYGRALAYPDPEAPPFPETRGTADLLVRLNRAETALERERAGAPALCRELLALPVERQMEALAGDPRLQTWGVCELLLRRSRRTRDQDPAEAARLALLVIAAAERLTGHPGPLIRDLEARAWAYEGEARLCAGDLAGGEEALRAAARRLAQGSGDLLVEALLLELEAAVREVQGCPSAASALLQQAASRYARVGETGHAGRVLAEREALLAHAGPQRILSLPPL